MALVREHSAGEIAKLDAVRLNLGAGETKIDGFTALDRKQGQEVFPLEFPDNTVDEIRASHILEHFGHSEVSAVVNHWVEKLKPGGKLRIAVPDFKWICEQYQAGVPIPLQGYLMGGQIDDNDIHKCAFDRESLHQLMANAGLERIGEWQSEIKDCAALPVSLNLQGFKPTAGDYKPGTVVAILSAPRFGPIMHMQCANRAFGQLKIPYRIMQGAYWHQIMEQLIEMQRHDAKYLITCDYDSIFTPQDVHELMRIMDAYEHIDALVPIQMKRHDDGVLLNVGGKQIYVAEFQQNVYEVESGHFGLTVFRSKAFENLPKPWFQGIPDEDGSWGKGRVDADIFFWQRWRKSLRTVFAAPRVVIGHMQEMIAWPDRNFQLHYQSMADFSERGVPAEVQR